MIGKKELKMVTIGKKLIDKYKKNFRVMENSDELCLRIGFIEKSGMHKVKELIMPADKILNCLEDMNFEDCQIFRIEIFVLNL